ncbi:hypothetical protein Pmani_037730 [Petrolisthes manimaculis]|uniref:Uncharacterized protein n=1 Tax=Petrolisthes manimaculis TaxID=1843537 RepID=A0AAE1TN05_9EUCA|nr:hypothetical protein Pmani_037730 [Petrolisthes manimaculis]
MDGVEWKGVGKDGVEWKGVGKDGVEWKGVGKDGVEWKGVGKDGVEWRGVGKDGGVGWVDVAPANLPANHQPLLEPAKTSANGAPRC